MSKYVLSTATCSQRFVEYAKGAGSGGLNVSVREITIRGGANSPSLTSGFGDLSQTGEGQPLWTPQGVVTKVTDDEAEFLRSHEGFIAAEKRGFYSILDSDPGDSHKKIADLTDDMTKRDKSAPLTPATAKLAVKVTSELKAEED